MTIRSLAVIVALFLSMPPQSSPQQTNGASTSSPQAAQLLAQSAAALSGSVRVSDVTLNGAVQSTVGPDEESGTVVMTAMAAGESRMPLLLPSGNRREIRTFDANGNMVGSWSGSDGGQHAFSAATPRSIHDIVSERRI